MSLSSIADAYAARTFGRDQSTSLAVEFTSGRKPNPVESATAQLIKWIPVEVLAFYIPAQDLTTDSRLLLGLYVLGLVLSPCFIFVKVREAFKRQKPKKPSLVFRTPVAQMVFAAVAFMTWGASLPKSIVIQSGAVPIQSMPLAILICTVCLSLADRFIASRLS